MFRLVYIDPESIMNIEYGGRTAWNSHDKRDRTTPNAYIAKLVGMNHTSVTEHGYGIVEFDCDEYPSLEMIVLTALTPIFDSGNPCGEIEHLGSVPLVRADTGKMYARFNFRALGQFLKKIDRILSIQEEFEGYQKHIYKIIAQSPVGVFANDNNFLKISKWTKLINKELKNIDEIASNPIMYIMNDTMRVYDAVLDMVSGKSEFETAIFKRCINDEIAIHKSVISFKLDSEDVQILVAKVNGKEIPIKLDFDILSAMEKHREERKLHYSRDYAQSVNGLSYVCGTDKIFYMHHDLAKLNNDIQLFSRRHGVSLENCATLFALTISFVMPNYISEQLLRHRILSPTKQSGRYINPDMMRKMYLPVGMNKDQAAHHKFILPCGDKLSLRDYYNLSHDMNDALQEFGVPKEDSRCVTPYAQERELIMSGSIWAWQHWLRLRTDKASQSYHTKFAHTLVYNLKHGATTRKYVEQFNFDQTRVFREKQYD